MAIGRAWPQYDSSGSGTPAAGSITLGQLADPGGMPVARGAAGFHDDPASYGEITWASSGQAFEVKAKARFTSTAPNRAIIGGQHTSDFLLQRTAAGGINFYVDGQNYGSPADSVPLNEDVEVHATWSSTVATIAVDGVEVFSAPTTGLVPTAPYTLRVGRGISVDHPMDGIIWDLELIDPADDTNTAVFLLDEQVAGKFLNSHPGSTVGDATITGEIGSTEINSSEPAAPLMAIPETGIERKHYNGAAGMPVVRQAAKFGPDGHEGNRVSFTTPTTAGTGFTVRWKMAVFTSPVTGRAIWSRRVTGGWSFLIDGTRAFLYENTGYDVTLGNADMEGLVPYDGTWHSYEAVVTPTTYSISRNSGEAVATGTHARPLATSGYIDFIGGSNVQWEEADCAISDFELIDASNAAHSAYFPLDARSGANEFPNLAPGSGVSDGVIEGAIISVEINSPTAGSGAPVPAGPLVCSQKRSTVASGFTADTTMAVSETVTDPYSMRSGSRIEIPVAGAVMTKLTGRYRATALSGSVDCGPVVQEQLGSPLVTQHLTLDTLNAWVPFAIVKPLGDFAAGTVFETLLTGITGSGATVEYDDVYWTLTLYPDLS